MNEFDIIRRYFARQPVTREDVHLGIGDDAAVVEVPADHELVISSDLLIGGVHFPADTHPAAIGHKALAVNLSDMAAMGATPSWMMLNLSLPEINIAWMEGFTTGLFGLAQKYDVQLIGGDTTRGPLTIGIQIHGWVARGQALTRSGARVGDRIYATGTLGDAALGLAQHYGRLAVDPEHVGALQRRLERPTPRIAIGQALRGIASACIDISDGLAADLGHVLEASGVGARVTLERLPLSPAYESLHAQVGWDPALSGGDDYELCFTVPAAQQKLFAQRLHDFDCSVTPIGEIEAQPGLRLIDTRGQEYHPQRVGFDHFAEL